MNGYNFTMRVRKVLGHAREEAARLGHEYVGTEHELLGLLRERDGVAATVLLNLHADANALRDRIESIVKRGSSEPVGPDLPYSSRAKKVLEYAMSESRELNHAYVGTEHLLLGLLREQKGMAAQVLVDSGITLDAVRAEVQRVLGSAPDPNDRLGAMHAVAERSMTASIAPGRVGIVLGQARQLAAQRGASRVSDAHAAIALIAHGEGVANAVLERLGCDVGQLRSVLEALAPAEGPAATLRGRTPITADFQQMLEAAWHEQQTWHAPTMQTHHLLLALLGLNPDVAAAFEARGVTAAAFRAEAKRIAE